VNQRALAPFGAALQGYHTGDSEAVLVIRRDDGFEDPIPVEHFFRPPAEFSKIELHALELCWGRVLDIGAGSGLHSLYLQSAGLEVTALDIDPSAVRVMSDRGVRELRLIDFGEFVGGPYDSLLLLGHGIGMVEDLEGLDRFLSHIPTITSPDAQILVHSRDVRMTEGPSHLGYHERNRQLGRYAGEIRLQFEYQGVAGPFCGWLHVDPLTLEARARPAGWNSEVALEGKSGEYLAVLRRLPGR
jgi:SAM-dependent methyltransferase